MAHGSSQPVASLVKVQLLLFLPVGATQTDTWVKKPFSKVSFLKVVQSVFTVSNANGKKLQEWLSTDLLNAVGSARGAAAQKIAQSLKIFCFDFQHLPQNFAGLCVKLIGKECGAFFEARQHLIVESFPGIFMELRGQFTQALLENQTFFTAVPGQLFPSGGGTADSWTQVASHEVPLDKMDCLVSLAEACSHLMEGPQMKNDLDDCQQLADKAQLMQSIAGIQALILSEQLLESPTLETLADVLPKLQASTKKSIEFMVKLKDHKDQMIFQQGLVRLVVDPLNETILTTLGNYLSKVGFCCQLLLSMACSVGWMDHFFDSNNKEFRLRYIILYMMYRL